MEVIEKKSIALNVTARMLGVQHLEEIVELRRNVLDNLMHEDNYVKEEDEFQFILHHLSEFGDSIGFFLRGELIAYTALTYDIISSQSFDEYKMIIDSNESIGTFGALAATLVHPNFQGLGIQARAIELRLELARKKGILDLGVTVSPHNKRSLYNIIKAGGEIRRMVSFEDGRTRFLLNLNVGKKKESNSITEVYVPLSKIALHNQFLNKGYHGNNIIKTGFDSYVSYVKNRKRR